MHVMLRRVFDRFPAQNIAIVGSSVIDVHRARDIDVLFLANADFPALMRALGVKYSGWDRGGRHIRRAAFWVNGVPKPVHLTQDSAVHQFSDHPYAVLLRDGRVLHEGQAYPKSSSYAVHPPRAMLD